MTILYRAFAIVVFVLIIATSAQAQGKTSGWIEFEGVVESETGTTPQINVYAHGPLKGSIGWTLYMQAGQEWGEGLVGLTFAPTAWLEVSGSLGLENFNKPLREGASIWVGKGKLSFLSLQEDGGSGYWQKNVGKYQLTPTFAIGGLQQTFIGFGPYVEKMFGRLAFWGAYAVTDNKGLITAQFNF